MSNNKTPNLISEVVIINGIYFTLGGLYQTPLSSQDSIDIKSIINKTNNLFRYSSSTSKIRQLICLATKPSLEESCKVFSTKKENKKDEVVSPDYIYENKITILEHEKLPILKSLPKVIAPLSLYFIENYTPLVQKKENCIVVFKIGERSKKGKTNEDVFYAITIFNNSLYLNHGEFIGNESEIIDYIKIIKSKIIFTSIHATSEIYQKIENTFFNDAFEFRKIGVDKTSKEFKLNSKDLFWNKNALAKVDKVKFLDYFHQNEKNKKITIIALSIFLAISTIAGVGYYFYQAYQEKLEQERIEREAKNKPIEYKNMSFNTIDYFIQNCFKDVNKFSSKMNNNWAVTSITCDNKPNSFKYELKQEHDMGNYLANKNDFLQASGASADDPNYVFSADGKSVTYKLPISFVGIKENMVKYYQEDEIRSAIANLTANSNNEYSISISANAAAAKDLTQSDLKNWVVKSNYSPIYLQNKYHLFDHVYVNSVKMTTDSNGLLNWEIAGEFTVKKTLTKQTESGASVPPVPPLNQNNLNNKGVNQ